ncbi:class I adenylate-forming enzyme family protein [Stetteria hydrogenophila]
MAARPWLRSWPEGVPESLDYPEVPAYAPVAEWASRDPGACALASEGVGCVSYRDAVEMARAAAAWLQGVGVGPGDGVVFSAFNTVEGVAGLLGVWMSGATAVVVDPLTTSEDLRFQLEGRGLRVAVVSGEFYERERVVLESLGVERVLLLDHASGGGLETLRGAWRRGLWREWREANAGPGDVAVAFYYAGIAGRTMQVLHTHYGVVSAATAYHAATQLRGRPRTILVAPLTHALGLEASVLTALYNGGAVYAMKRWDPEAAARLLSGWGVNYLAGAPMMYESLLKAAGGGIPGARLELAVSGGAPLKPEVQDRFREAFGAPLTQLYGMTEAWILTLQPRHLAGVKSTVGIPLPDVYVKIVDPEDAGRELGPGELGELLVKAPWVMKGYEDEEETRRVFVDGWLRTGDLMEMDERGLLYFRGVRKRMIKYKAYPIFPRDLEVILERHPAVEEARVYGEPHPDYGQIPVAEVRLKPGWRGRVPPEELMDYVNRRVAFYKKVRRLVIRE